MKKQIKKSIGDTLYAMLIFAIVWVAISVIIQRFKCPKMTETELFINIPNSVVCNWQDCN